MDLISVKNTRTCHSFATVSKHIPHFYLQYKEGPDLTAQKSIVQCHTPKECAPTV